MDLIKDLFKCSPGGRMTGDERREQILAAAVELFSQRGFSGTTTKQIAIASGVSEAMVFRHFATKDTLYDAILESKGGENGGKQFPWVENEALREALAAKDDYGVFFHLGLHALNRHRQDEGFMRLLFYSALEDHWLAERFFSEFVSKIYEFIGAYIAERQRDGAIRELEPGLIVRAYLGMLIHHSLNNMLWDKKLKIMDVSNEEAAKQFAGILLDGIRK
ncbi:MAG: TetR/AcrR family transcriptional regulator [Acidobacteriota bacterium]